MKIIEANGAEAYELIRRMHLEEGCRLSTISGVDVPEGVELLYHLSFDTQGKVVTVRVLVTKPELKAKSVTSFMPAADWVEREIHEMLGVDFEGHPNLDRLLLPDDWPKGVYPYRKKSLESEKEIEEKK